MVRRLKCGHDSPARRVALNTLSGGSPKNPLKVTPFALDLRMSAAERKSRGAMIQFDVGAAAAFSAGSIG